MLSVGFGQMANEKRNHYVPKFYLNLFKSSNGKIHLYRLDKRKPHKDVTLRDQCRVNWLYGKDGRLENVLGSIERRVSDSLRGVASSGELPTRDSEQYSDIIAFVAVQLARTPAKAMQMGNVTTQLVETVFAGRRGDQLADTLTGALAEPDSLDVMRFMLECAPEFYSHIFDLESLLVVCPDPCFITSDNPVALYNQYCEQIQNRGCIGARSEGLQIFLPLNPHACLVMFDGSVYAAQGDDNGRIQSFGERDVRTLNKLQIMTADAAVYFSNWRTRKEITRIAKGNNALGRKIEPIVKEYPSVSGDDGSLIHAYPSVPNLSVELSFLTVKESAKRVSLEKRATKYRNTLRVRKISFWEGIRTLIRNSLRMFMQSINGDSVGRSS